MRIVTRLSAGRSLPVRSSAMFAVALAVAASAGCVDGAVDDPGAGDAGASAGGAGFASGGAAVPGTGGSGSAGASSGTGGAITGSGGRVSGTGGRATGTGGTHSGSGGAASGTGGRPGTGGASSATGGRIGGTGGRGTGGTGGTGSSGAATGGTGTGTGGGGSATGGSGTGGSGSGGTAPTGTGGSTAPANSCSWPTAMGANQPVTSTMNISGTFDGGMKRFVGSGALGTAGQGEDQGPLFQLSNGAILKNVIIGAPAADGIHCSGTCTLLNVWWEDVGEDAATLKGSNSSQVMTIDGGGATKAADKVFQHNGPGTMIVKNFCASDFGKLYRSCGNCEDQYARHSQFENITITPRAGTSIAGVNANYNDTATFKNINIKGAVNSVVICQRYTGNATGAEPPKAGAGADGTVCKYAPSDIMWQ